MPKNEVDEFLGEVEKGEEADPFEKESEDPFEKVPAPAAEEGTEEEIADEKPIPFHKDPKVQRYIQREIAKLQKDTPTETDRFIQESVPDEEMDAVLNRVIGNDTPEKVQGVKDMKRILLGLTNRAQQAALAEIESRQTAEQEADIEAENELETGFENIEDTFGVDITSNAPLARKTRNEFIDYVKKIAPKDENGEVVAFPDMESAFEEFQEKRKRVPQPNNRAKDLASRSMGRSSDASTAPAKGNTWKDVDKLFSTLQK